MRIVHVARDATFQRMIARPDVAARVVRSRAGHAFDPVVATRLADDVGKIFAGLAEGSTLAPDEWERVRLHAYHSERVLARSLFLAGLASVATATTSGSTGRGTTGAPPPGRSRCRRASSPRPTPTAP